MIYWCDEQIHRQNPAPMCTIYAHFYTATNTGSRAQRGTVSERPVDCS